YRVPERVLLALAVFGGSPGALMGMLVFHHKTRKSKFMVLVPLFLILHLLAGILRYYLVPGTVV
ncbi:MAG: DUF1294 domain-containing protein, partial [Lachnospiraceae bacterium]|nr:DUF1294 domain-containing protein [Lachnospiraceae bacterium]